MQTGAVVPRAATVHETAAGKDFCCLTVMLDRDHCGILMRTRSVERHPDQLMVDELVSHRE